MKPKQKKTPQKLLSDKIADALTVKPRADIEDDQVFGTKPKTVTRGDFGSSDSEVEAAISDFRKRNVGLLSEVSKKYEGQVVSRKDLEESGDDDDSSDDDEVPYKTQLQKKKQDVSKVSDESDSEIELPKLKSKAQDSDVDDSESEGESDDYSIMQFKKQLNDDSDDEEAGSDDEEGSDEDDGDDEEGEGFDISQMEEPMKEEFEHVKKQNISEEAKKGICVRNQLLLWENLLEMRIHLQRCVNTANQMPMPDTYSNLKENEDFAEETNATKANISNVLDKLLSLQNLLLSKYPETKTISNKKLSKQQAETKQTKEDSDEEIPSDTDNEEIPSDTDAEDDDVKEVQMPKNKTNKSAPAKKRKLEDYESDISNSHKAFKTFRDTSIQKWNDKTRLATATNIKNTPTNTVLQQISYILSDREKLVKRTQLKRSEYDIIGYERPHLEDENQNGNEAEVNPVTRDRKDNDEYIPEIFDDSDFYHQLLRELIECKSADISDPVQLSRQWIALQQMRSKMKRKVDTKASKGRKIKYVVHNKLVNFMAPEKSVSWTDESKNELYSSLFGKLFEQNNIGLNANVNGFKLKN
ncbi:protein Aatf [Spodoptera litura]|uniref:Protein Aatf n=1 Tax=Spodoptera litura TaxID=69820 RepID=A0A9J7DWH0_SPOLT|nr:protein Aatf [Spodoptera litura]